MYTIMAYIVRDWNNCQINEMTPNNVGYVLALFIPNQEEIYRIFDIKTNHKRMILSLETLWWKDNGYLYGQQLSEMIIPMPKSIN